ncbi:MAG: hypothetical protein ACYCS1_02990 [Gammaproteobacteria bacterium]
MILILGQVTLLTIFIGILLLAKLMLSFAVNHHWVTQPAIFWIQATLMPVGHRLILGSSVWGVRWKRMLRQRGVCEVLALPGFEVGFT